MDSGRTIRFKLGGMVFEYNETKNDINVKKHGLSFRSASRVFFDYDRIELYDEENSIEEDRYDTIGDASVAVVSQEDTVVIGHVVNDILFVVYTERSLIDENGVEVTVTRLISARRATSFERGLYYGKYQ